MIEQLDKISKQKSIIDSITSDLAVFFHNLDANLLVPTHLHKLGHPAGVFNKFPIQHYQSAVYQ